MQGFRAWDRAALQRSSKPAAILARVRDSRAMTASRPAPLADLPEARARAVVGVLTDIDDTLTDARGLDPAAGAALDLLRAARIPVIAVTGRPKGWSEPFALAWPIEAIVAENGAVALFREHGALAIEYAQDEATRAANARRLEAAAARVLREVPGARLATDSAGRVTDIAVDHSEHAHLSRPQVERVVAVMRAEGLHATVSSIHVNGWYGEHDKLSGARWIVRRRLGRDLDAELDRWVYVGDSTNDQRMFGHFPLSVGVANLMRFADELDVWPAYLTTGERGAGFAEVARRLVEARR